MTSTIPRNHQTEEEFLAHKISDEALETAAGTRHEKAGIYPLGSSLALPSVPANNLALAF